MKLLDRYLVAEFCKALLMALAAFLVIFILVDVFEKLDFFIDARAPLGLVALFYLYQIPYILTLVLPVAMLLASMSTTSQMARHNELISMKAAGINLYRIFLPLFGLGLAVSLLALVVGETVVPASNKLRGQLERIQIRKQTPQSQQVRANLLYDGALGRQYFIRRLDAGRGTMDSVSIIHLDQANAITMRIDARHAVWSRDHWELEGVIRRRFAADGSELADSLSWLSLAGYPETPADFIEREVLPDEMGFVELRRYIDRIRRSGGDVKKSVVDLYLKLSFPFANFIILLFGLPILSNARRSGAALSFAISMMICFIFWGILQTGRALGHNASLSPILAAWLPNLTFGAVGAILLHRAPK